MTTPDKPQHYTKKPVTIQALKWTGSNLRDVITFTDGPPDTRSHHAGMMWDQYEDLVAREGLKLFTLEGPIIYKIGTMIIKGVRGEFYGCDPDIFDETYSPAVIAAMPDTKALDAADRLADAYASLCNMTGKNYHEHEGSCYATYRAARGGKA